MSVSNSAADGVMSNLTLYSLLTILIKLDYYPFFWKVIESLSLILSFAIGSNGNAKIIFSTFEIPGNVKRVHRCFNNKLLTFFHLAYIQNFAIYFSLDAESVCGCDYGQL